MLSPFRAAICAALVGAVAPSSIAQEESKPTPEANQKPESQKPESQKPESQKPEGQQPQGQEPELTPEQEYAQMLERFEAKTGTIDLGGVATIKLGEGWHWLDGPNAQELLMAFGNQRNPSVRGMALPPDYVESNVFAVYMLDNDGHVEDEEPDYDELLASMKEATVEGNKQRQKAGYPGVELIGWAEPPHYDQASHKLYWAKELQFEGDPARTLNYNVRVLGRTGNIEINGVGDIGQLALVDKHCKELLGVTEFVEGKRYSDFDPEYDKVAAYGIGGLIAGKLALKAGLFAKLGVLLLKFLKPILVGLAVLGGLLFKIFGGRRRQASEAEAESLPPAGAE